jgi:hypothetical protein
MPASVYVRRSRLAHETKRCELHRFASSRYHTNMKAITVRLDEADNEALTRQARHLRVQPGTLARMLVHAGLSEDRLSRADARAAVARLVRRSQRGPSADAVRLVDDARAALGAHE